MKIFLVFPIHLFKDISAFDEADKVFIIEEPLYYDHVHKKYKVSYYDFNDNYLKDIPKNSDVLFYDPVDHDLMKKLRSASNTHGFTIDLLETPAFITPYEDLEEYNKKTSGKKFMHDSSFYRWQRQRLEILTPIGSKYKLSYIECNIP